MKWFKHISTASNDPVIHEAIQKFGPLGYWFYFGILELIATNFDPRLPGKLTISWLQVQRLFISRRLTVQQLLLYFSTKGKLVYEDQGDTVLIYVPKFEVLADQYTKRTLLKSANIVHTPMRTNYTINRIDKDKTPDTNVSNKQRSGVSSNEYTSSDEEHDVAGAFPQGGSSTSAPDPDPPPEEEHLLEELAHRVTERRRELGLDPDIGRRRR